jgi:hypothetical protein
VHVKRSRGVEPDPDRERKQQQIERMWVLPLLGLPKPPLMSRWQATMGSFRIREE